MFKGQDTADYLDDILTAIADDVLIHDYMGVDLKTVWKVAQERLPELKALLSRIGAAKRDS